MARRVASDRPLMTPLIAARSAPLMDGEGGGAAAASARPPERGRRRRRRRRQQSAGDQRAPRSAAPQPAGGCACGLCPAPASLTAVAAAVAGRGVEGGRASEGTASDGGGASEGLSEEGEGRAARAGGGQAHRGEVAVDRSLVTRELDLDVCVLLVPRRSPRDLALLAVLEALAAGEGVAPTRVVHLVSHLVAARQRRRRRLAAQLRTARRGRGDNGERWRTRARRRPQRGSGRRRDGGGGGDATSGEWGAWPGGWPLIAP